MRSLISCLSFPSYELANQFNRAVGRSKKIIGAGRLFKIRGTANRQWFSVEISSVHLPRYSVFTAVTLNSSYDNIDSVNSISTSSFKSNVSLWDMKVFFSYEITFCRHYETSLFIRNSRTQRCEKILNCKLTKYRENRKIFTGKNRFIYKLLFISSFYVYLSKNVYFRRFIFKLIPVWIKVISVRLEIVRKKLAIKTSLRNSRLRSTCRATIIKDNESGSRKVPIARVIPSGRKPLQCRASEISY